MFVIYFSKSKNVTKKYSVLIGNKTVNFGANGYSDYTIHKDDKRKQRYINRHKGKENWGKSGIKTAGFWARWALWNKKTSATSLKDIESKFNVKIKKVRLKIK